MIRRTRCNYDRSTPLLIVGTLLRAGGWTTVSYLFGGRLCGRRPGWTGCCTHSCSVNTASSRSSEYGFSRAIPPRSVTESTTSGRPVTSTTGRLANRLPISKASVMPSISGMTTSANTKSTCAPESITPSASSPDDAVSTRQPQSACDQLLKRRQRIGIILDDKDDVATKWLFWLSRGLPPSPPHYWIVQPCRPTLYATGRDISRPIDGVVEMQQLASTRNGNP